VDVGANHGAFSVAASSLVGEEGQVIAVEPQPNLARLVRQSLRENRNDNFKVFQEVCADNSKDLAFFINDRSSGTASVYAAATGRVGPPSIAVRTRPLDDLLEQCRITGRVLIKLDVEGSEHAVLHGARQFIARHRPSLILEINAHAMAAAGIECDDLVRTLMQCGYESFRTLDAPDTCHELPRLVSVRKRDVLLQPTDRDAGSSPLVTIASGPTDRRREPM
jgi:FkbM family methyltransferase